MMNQSYQISFTRQIKEEIASLSFEDSLLNKSLLSGFIKINSHLVLRNGDWILSIRSENIKTAKLIISLIEKEYLVKTRIAISEQKRFKKDGHEKTVIIEIHEKSKQILNDLELYNESDGFNCYPVSLTKDLESKRYYLTGCFLATGSINDPSSKNYHLEIAVASEEYAKFIITLFKKFYIEPKYIVRRNQFVVYLKKSESIADFIKLLRASQSLYHFEDVRIQRDQLNSINRIMNCEISNEKKALEAANEQYEAISWYKERYGLEELTPKLIVIAQSRLAAPEATYNELIVELRQTFNLYISKSGLAYRMTKLMEIINKRRKV